MLFPYKQIFNIWINLGQIQITDNVLFQINGFKVSTKQKAQEMFVSMQGDISLLVVRPPTTGVGDCYEEDIHDLLDISDNKKETVIKEFDIHGSSGDISELVEHEQKNQKRDFLAQLQKTVDITVKQLIKVQLILPAHHLQNYLPKVFMVT